MDGENCSYSSIFPCECHSNVVLNCTNIVDRFWMFWKQFLMLMGSKAIPEVWTSKNLILNSVSEHSAILLHRTCFAYIYIFLFFKALNMIYEQQLTQPFNSMWQVLLGPFMNEASWGIEVSSIVWQPRYCKMKTRTQESWITTPILWGLNLLLQEKIIKIHWACLADFINLCMLLTALGVIVIKWWM